MYKRQIQLSDQAEDIQESEEPIVSFAFTTLAKVSSPLERGVGNIRKPFPGAKLEYYPDEYNTIGGKFTEYFTSKLARDCVVHSDALLVSKESFRVDINKDHVDAFLTECIVCGGRGFFGLKCQKCKVGMYNLGVGFCLECETSGPLGSVCTVCYKNNYRALDIK